MHALRRLLFPLVAFAAVLATLGMGTVAFAAEAASNSLEGAINDAFGGAVEAMATVLFFPIARFELGGGGVVEIPAVVAWLAIGAVFFTVRLGFVNLRLFGHALTVVRGRYDNPADPGEVTHFQALSTALSATVGLGNIAGVAVALMVGGPGATFWLIVFGLFGMSTKFVECTFGVKYRVTDESGQLQGGPMRYLRTGLANLGFRRFGKVLAGLFAVLCVGASFGGGNMFQVGQSYSAVNGALEGIFGVTMQQSTYGIIMLVLVGLVIIGGIQSIARVADKIVPAMVIIYMVCTFIILGTHASAIPDAFGAILDGAFTSEAGLGGVIGTMIQGIRRAVFSNEAGIGSAAVAHSAAKTSRPVREGTVALLEPFIDTVVVCTLTALAIIVTGVLNDPGNSALIAGKQGAALTAVAFGTVVSWFPHLLALCVFLFAFSTMISWSYYGERSFAYVFGPRFSLVYKVIFLGFVYLGAVSNLGNVIDFSDMMILAMSVPNMLGLYFLSNEIARDTKGYIADWRAGRFEEERPQAGS
jgi:AGCS family alanine or glycine:cation symporter